jgi:iron(III) transport system permease protein
MKQHHRRLDIVLAVALAAFVLLPWYRIEDGFLSLGWLNGMFGDGATAPGLWQMVFFGRHGLALSLCSCCFVPAPFSIAW